MTFIISETVCLYHLSLGKIPRPTEKLESPSLTPLGAAKGDLGINSVTDCAGPAEKFENKKAMTSILKSERNDFLVSTWT